jgi:DNA-binding MarR family transcriptional regulator
VAELNDVIHQPVRLRIAAALDALRSDESVEFSFLRQTLDLTDGNLGAHLRRLEEARYVHLEKTFVDRKPRTYVSLTAQGRRAFREHVQALRDILARRA